MCVDRWERERERDKKKEGEGRNSDPGLKHKSGKERRSGRE